MKRLFEQILKKYRIRSGITQEFMVDLLSNSSSKLKKLDNVTFSRWERGVTIPPFRKQIEIYQLLEVDPIDELIELDIKLPSIDSHEYFVADHYVESIKTFASYSLNHTNIIDIDLFMSDIELITAHDLYFQRLMTAFSVTDLKEFTSMLITLFNAEIIFCKNKERLIGHSITIHCDSDFITDIMSNNIDNLKIELYLGSNPFVVSFHSSTLSSFEFVIGNILNKYMEIPSLDVKLYLSSIDKTTHKLFSKLKAKVKYNEIYNNQNQKTAALSKIDVSVSREAMYLITSFRRKRYEK